MQKKRASQYSVELGHNNRYGLYMEGLKGINSCTNKLVTK